MGSLTKFQAGALLAVVGVVVIAAAVLIGSKALSSSGCALTGAGLGAVIEGATRGHSSGAQLIATTGVSATCKPLADALIARSSQNVEFKLKDTATESEFKLPAVNLVEPAPPVAEESPRNILECFIEYRASEFLYRLCLSGVLPASSATTTGEIATSTEEDEEEPTLTHAQFIRQLDGICRRYNKAEVRFDRRVADPVFERSGERAWEKVELRYAKRHNPLFHAEVEALAAPPEDENGLRRYLDLTRQREVLYVRWLREHNDAEIARLDRLIDRVRNRRTLVTSRMGLRVCGS